MDNSIPSVGWAKQRQNVGRWERYWWSTDLVLETAENFEEGSLLPWSSQDHLWEHLVLLEKIFLVNEFVQVLLLGFSLPADASCDLPQVRQSWQKELKSVCILPHLLSWDQVGFRGVFLPGPPQWFSPNTQVPCEESSPDPWTTVTQTVFLQLPSVFPRRVGFVPVGHRLLCVYVLC